MHHYTLHSAELTWNQKAANFIISCCKRIVHPSATDKESSLKVIVDVWQWSEAMGPQTESIELGTGYSVITDQPAGCCKSNNDANEGNGKNRYPAIARRCSAPHVLPRKWSCACHEFIVIWQSCAKSFTVDSTQRGLQTLSNFSNQLASATSAGKWFKKYFATFKWNFSRGGKLNCFWWPFLHFEFSE